MQHRHIGAANKRLGMGGDHAVVQEWDHLSAAVAAVQTVDRIHLIVSEGRVYSGGTAMCRSREEPIPGVQSRIQSHAVTV